MRIFKETKSIQLPEDITHRFFIQIWYSLVHRNSLDSHRVRCMNSLNILRENQDLILKENLGDIYEDIRRGAEESLVILSRDKIVSKYFSEHFNRIKPLLEDIAKGTKKEESRPSVKMLSYYLKDILSELVEKYKTNILVELEKAIFESKSQLEIYEYTGTLLSVLIDEGHSIEELFGIIQNIFINNRRGKEFSFADNFQLTKQIVDHGNYTYQSLFRLKGCKKNEFLPSELTDIQFEKEPVIENADETVKSFLYPGQKIVFAKITAAAQDDRSAGIIAKKRLDDLLDLIRFELEQEVITVDKKFVSIRPDKLTARIFRLPSEIPNPNKNITAEDFKQFIHRVNNLIETHSIDRESREKIKSAIRFYRMGRDSEQFGNKYLNWWTALEYLLRSAKGKIIDEIENKLKAVLLSNYITKYLQSYKSTLSYCRVKPTMTVCEKFSIATFAELSNFDFFYLLRDQTEIDSIDMQLSKYPAVVFRLDRFINRIKNSNSLLSFISAHEKNVSWHIHRIWRVRCDIVHSAEYSLNLILLSANLEYYLKYLLNIILSALNENKSISGLNELFTRMDYVQKRLMKELNEDKQVCLDELLKGEGL